jgi:hypothetical protein
MKTAVFWDVTLHAGERSDVSEQRIAFIIRVEIISELRSLAVTINWTPEVASSLLLLTLYLAR